ncbi:MAG TPA: leucyl aminopeptidase family protein [Gammaproteobacteria bacterium]|nr:leucyl aminopeptidase family protein [Gammaproteobacteria bacterium]
MPSRLPPLRTVTVELHATELDRGRADTLGALFVALPDAARTGGWPPFPYSDILQERYRARVSGKPPVRFTSALPNTRGTHAGIAFLKPDASTFELLTVARKLLAEAAGARTAACLAAGLDATLAARFADAMVAAALAQAFPLPDFRSRPEPAARIESLMLFGFPPSTDLRRTEAAASGNNLARWLTTLPANELTPAQYRAHIEELAGARGWQFEFFDEQRLKELGAGAFLAVARGSAERNAGIARLRRAPRGTASRHIALVGKGVCFDTGGSNLKTAKGMFGMHGDMQGSAVALGTLLALDELGAEFPAECWLALVQNRIGPTAYTQNEVVTACNGTTIEVVHTDAEGRMILADTLALAGRDRPALILDYATLTGACVYALGKLYSGAFTNRPELVPLLIEAGRTSGERVWPFPGDTDYDELLESRIADVKQCLLDGEADHILAARFLSRFVPEDVPWIHIDMSAGEQKDGLAHVPGEFTGFGVRLALDLLLDRDEIRQWIA